MQKSNGRLASPVCLMLLHQVINQMSIIIGNCELVMEKSPADSDYIKRLELIGETAHRVVTAMKDHQCEVTNLLRTAEIVETVDPGQASEAATGGSNSKSIDTPDVQVKHHSPN